jgi:hypothetical protein
MASDTSIFNQGDMPEASLTAQIGGLSAAQPPRPSVKAEQPAVQRLAADVQGFHIPIKAFPGCGIEKLDCAR